MMIIVVRISVAVKVTSAHNSRNNHDKNNQQLQRDAPPNSRDGFSGSDESFLFGDVVPIDAENFREQIFRVVSLNVRALVEN